MPWTIHLEPEVTAWLHELRATDRETLKDISAAIDVLKDLGPAAGRPLVDKIQHSTVHNLKELRPPSTGTSEVRALFVFDEQRQAVFLVIGDKQGDWNRWYDQAIPLAEDRLKRHMLEHVQQTASKRAQRKR